MAVADHNTRSRLVFIYESFQYVHRAPVHVLAVLDLEGDKSHISFDHQVNLGSARRPVVKTIETHTTAVPLTQQLLHDQSLP